MWRFFKGWSCGSLVTNRKYQDTWEWPLLSCNYRELEPRVGVIVDRRWHWFGIINRAWGPDGYGYGYYRNKYGDLDVEMSWGMKRWGWEYQILIEGELKWLWYSEFLVINQI